VVISSGRTDALDFVAELCVLPEDVLLDGGELWMIGAERRVSAMLCAFAAYYGFTAAMDMSVWLEGCRAKEQE
jgi:hypothetical protein